MSLLSGLIVLALLATVVALGAGIVSMSRGGAFDEAHSTQLMFARVGLQGVTFVLLVIALVIANI